MGETGHEGPQIDTKIRINELGTDDLRGLMPGWNPEEHAAGSTDIDMKRKIGEVNYHLRIDKKNKLVAFHSLNSTEIAIETFIRSVDRVEFDHARKAIYFMGSEQYKIGDGGLRHTVLTRDGKKVISDFRLSKTQ